MQSRVIHLFNNKSLKWSICQSLFFSVICFRFFFLVAILVPYFLCISINLSTYQYIHPSIDLYTCTSNISIYLLQDNLQCFFANIFFVVISFYLPIYIYIFLYMYLYKIYPSVYLTISPSIYSSIYIFTYLQLVYCNVALAFIRTH